MFRFFCTSCKKIKHVRIIPKNILSHYELIKDPTQRKGVCDYHSSNSSHKSFNDYERNRK